MSIPAQIRRVTAIFKLAAKSGLSATAKSVSRGIREKQNYQKWIKRSGTLNDKQRRDIRSQIEAFDNKPLISILLPVYDTDEKWLRLCIDSVFKQIYPNWQLCIADDCSLKPQIRPILEEYAAKDSRVKVLFRKTNGHISEASNSALAFVSGEFTVLLDHDDELAEDALFWVAREINDFPETAMIYSDEDLIDEKGRRFSPKFKPDWSRDLFYSVNLITHLSAYRTDILKEIGGFRLGFEGSQDYDLALRVIERIPEKDIRHIPRILYHWRGIRGSAAFGGGEKPYAHERAREAIRSHFERIGKKAIVSETPHDLHRVSYCLPENPPKVSVILSADSVEDVIGSITYFMEQTEYRNIEFVLISNKEFKPDVAKNMKAIVTNLSGRAERLNLAVSQTDGEILCFANANLRPMSENWLSELVSFALQPEIGAVGAKLLYKNETVLHGGLIIGAGETIGIAHHTFPAGSRGNISRNVLIGNFSAISASCMVVRRDVFDEAGGFDAKHLPDKFFDADFCLRLREKNYRIVFTPYAELKETNAKEPSNHEDATAAEKDYFVEKWAKFIECDPFCNPNLSRKDGSFSIGI